MLWAGRALAGVTPLGLRALYASALVAGWAMGNLYVARTRGEVPALQRILLPLYLLSPPGLLFLLWSTAESEWQVNVPMAPVYASGIYAIFFLVPLSFARGRRVSGKG